MLVGTDDSSEFVWSEIATLRKVLPDRQPPCHLVHMLCQAVRAILWRGIVSLVRLVTSANNILVWRVMTVFLLGGKICLPVVSSDGAFEDAEIAQRDNPIPTPAWPRPDIPFVAAGCAVTLSTRTLSGPLSESDVVETYDEEGLLLSRLIDGDVDGNFEDVSRWTRGRGGRVELIEDSNSVAGTTGERRYGYDAAGALLFVRRFVNGSERYRTSYWHSATGELVREARDGNADGVFDRFVEYTNDQEPHRLHRCSAEINSDGVRIALECWEIVRSKVMRVRSVVGNGPELDTIFEYNDLDDIAMVWMSGPEGKLLQQEFIYRDGTLTRWSRFGTGGGLRDSTRYYYTVDGRVDYMDYEHVDYGKQRTNVLIDCDEERSRFSGTWSFRVWPLWRESAGGVVAVRVGTNKTPDGSREPGLVAAPSKHVQFAVRASGRHDRSAVLPGRRAH